MAARTGQPQRQESGRSILRIEHAVRDFDEWKRVFDDRGPLLRQQFGARSHQVFRTVADPNFVMVDIDFDSSAQAEGFLARLRDLWGQREAEGLIVGPQGRIVVAVENRGEG